jgi:hypothetical protein
MRIVAFLTAPPVIDRILAHLRRSAQRVRHPRAPPRLRRSAILCAGRLKFLFCILCGAIEIPILFCTDLFLDYWQPADGSPGEWLDEDELDAALRASLLDAASFDIVQAERAAIAAELIAGTWPPARAREMDLAEARRLLE